MFRWPHSLSCFAVQWQCAGEGWIGRAVYVELEAMFRKPAVKKPRAQKGQLGPSSRSISSPQSSSQKEPCCTVCVYRTEQPMFSPVFGSCSCSALFSNKTLNLFFVSSHKRKQLIVDSIVKQICNLFTLMGLQTCTTCVFVTGVQTMPIMAI